MFNASVLFLHCLFALVVFSKKWQDETLSAAFINVGLIGILFSVGWTISGSLAKLMWPEKGVSVWYDMDSLSLTILAAGELFFYRIYYKGLFASTAGGTEKQ